jgi:NAD(P)-dependent dehydrogenase (short-subunit alcohol dehydrogenase family)
MHDDLKRTAVVTGGNRGIGESITRAFVDEGWRVVVGSRTEPTFADGSTVWFVRTDVRDPAAVDSLADSAIQLTGRIDTWVNCAGYSAWKPLLDVTEDFWDDMIGTNLKGTMFGCKAAASRMGDGGSIVNVSSLAGRRGSANNSVYCASKFGVTGLTQALAKELGGGGIRVTAVCPVYVVTDGLLAALDDPRSPTGGKDTAEYLAEFAKGQAALQRLPEGREVAAAVLWLASSQASAVTGQSLNVDCGVMPA